MRTKWEPDTGFPVSTNEWPVDTCDTSPETRFVSRQYNLWSAACGFSMLKQRCNASGTCGLPINRIAECKSVLRWRTAQTLDDCKVHTFQFPPCNLFPDETQTDATSTTRNCFFNHYFYSALCMCRVWFSALWFTIRFMIGLYSICISDLWQALCTGPCTGIEFQASKKYCEATNAGHGLYGQIVRRSLLSLDFLWTPCDRPGLATSFSPPRAMVLSAPELQNSVALAWTTAAPFSTYRCF